jgi:hypothetical protein
MSITRYTAGLVAGAAILASAAPAIAGNQTFGGFECPIDCKGHRAGFVWAHENHVPNKSGCIVGSREFIEGCQTFIDDPLRNSDLDDAGAKIDW